MPASSTTKADKDPFSLLVASNQEKLSIAAKCLQESTKKLITKIESQDSMSIYDLCTLSDSEIKSALAPHYLNLPKGTSFPTSVSKNQIACNYSPQSKSETKSEDELKAGDVVKIECGVQIDNFSANLAHTMIRTTPSANESNECLNEHALPMLFMNQARELIQFHLVPDSQAESLIKHIGALADAYGCTIMSDVMCYNVSKDIAQTKSKVFYLKPSQEMKKESYKVSFESNDLFIIDLMVTKTKEDEGKKNVTLVPSSSETTLFRIPEGFVDAKLKQANALRGKLAKQHGFNVFNLRDEAPNAAWSMLKNYIEDFPVSKASNNQNVYRLKMTLQVKNKKAKVVAGIIPDLRAFKKIAPEVTLPEDVQSFLTQAKTASK